jgi:hypothetical protein
VVVRTGGAIRRIIRAPVLGIMVVTIRAGTVDVFMDTVAVDIIDTGAGTCARVG